MHIFKLVFLITIITSCQNSPGGRMPTTRELGMSSDLHPILKEGTFKVEYYPSKEITTGHKQLLQKLSKLIETNSRTQKYFRQIEEGGKPAYHSDIGISRQEYNRLIELFSYKATEKFNGTLTVSKAGKHLTFKGDGRLSLLDSVTVNLNSISASFKQYNMSRVKDSIDLSNEDIPQSDTLEIFEFYRGPDGLLGLTGLDGVYELLIGRLMPSGRTYLSLFARQPDNLEHPLPDYITVILY